MQPLAVRTTQTSADEGRLKVAAGRGDKKKALKKVIAHKGMACTGANCQYC